VMDEFTRECLAVKAARSLTSHHVIEVLTDLFIERGVPVHIRSDNGPEFIAKRVRDWLEKVEGLLESAVHFNSMRIEMGDEQ